MPRVAVLLLALVLGGCLRPHGAAPPEPASIEPLAVAQMSADDPAHGMARIRGRVIGEVGDAVDGATVVATWQARDRRGATNAITGLDGKYAMIVGAGIVAVTVSYADTVAEWRVEIAANTEVQLPDLRTGSEIFVVSVARIPGRGPHSPIIPWRIRGLNP